MTATDTGLRKSEPILGRVVSRFLEVLRISGLQLWLTIKNRLSRESITGESKCIVSLTSHGTRLRSAYLAIEAIAAGHERPARVILTIDPEVNPESLPGALQRLRKRGLEIIVADGHYGPHAKYYPALTNYADLRYPLVTADDDIVYPKRWLQDLMRVAGTGAKVVCYRSHLITMDDRGRIRPYMEWMPNNTGARGPRVFATGVMGVLYPPSFQEHLLKQGESFLSIAPKADDVWLHVQALRSAHDVTQLHRTSSNFPMFLGTQRSSLASTNAFSGGNDAQIAAAYSDEDIHVLRRDSWGG